MEGPFIPPKRPCSTLPWECKSGFPCISGCFGTKSGTVGQKSSCLGALRNKSYFSPSLLGLMGALKILLLLKQKTD